MPWLMTSLYPEVVLKGYVVAKTFFLGICPVLVVVPQSINIIRDSICYLIENR